MIYTCKPKKIALYINTGRKTTAQIKAETGCTALINGGLFDMSTFKPVCHLKADGQVLAKDQYKYWGFGWNTNDITLTQDYTGFSNYICCVCMVRDGKAQPMYYDSAMGGYRPRTALGVFPDGRIWLYADTSTTRTPGSLQKYALSFGVKHAIMLDGGGSTQGASPEGTVNGSRIVHNYICVWADEPEGEDTMAKASEVIKIAEAEVGYLEKASNSNLDSKTGNAGYNNWTKYARDLASIPGFYNGNKNGFAWCDVFVDWCFVKAFGVETAKKLLNHDQCGAGCVFSAQYFRKAGRFYASPKVGDQIFFGTKGNEYHTGLVYAVDSSRVYTIEGNTTGESGVVANGGGVFKKSYSLSYSKIAGYGRPNYDGTTETTTTKEVTCTVELNQLKSGSTGNSVKALQILLNGYGYSCGTADGIFGSKTLTAVKKFQAAKGLTADGICGALTWAKLLK